MNSKETVLKGFGRSIEYVLESFGFDNLADSTNSLFGGIGTQKALLFCSFCGTMATFIEDWVGIESTVYVALLGIFLVEFCTGVSASILVKKEKFSSYKLGRIVVKIFVYTMLLVLFNAFKEHLGGINVLSIDFNFFEWIYYIVLNLLILQLIVSVFENLETLGWKEVVCCL